MISHHPQVLDYLASARTFRFSRPGGGATRVDEVTLETTGGTRVSEWLSRPWAYEDEHEKPEERGVDSARLAAASWAPPAADEADHVPSLAAARGELRRLGVGV